MRKNVATTSEHTARTAHDSDREERQPYAKELDDYAHGVANPPQGKSEAGHPHRPPEKLGNGRSGGRG